MARSTAITSRENETDVVFGSNTTRHRDQRNYQMEHLTIPSHVLRARPVPKYQFLWRKRKNSNTIFILPNRNPFPPKHHIFNK